MLSDARKTRFENSKEDIHANRISTIDVDDTIDDRTDNKSENDLFKYKSSPTNDIKNTLHTGTS